VIECSIDWIKQQLVKCLLHIVFAFQQNAVGSVDFPSFLPSIPSSFPVLAAPPLPFYPLRRVPLAGLFLGNPIDV